MQGKRKNKKEVPRRRNAVNKQIKLGHCIAYIWLPNMKLLPDTYHKDWIDFSNQERFHYPLLPSYN
jgi:hypothetical protein